MDGGKSPLRVRGCLILVGIWKNIPDASQHVVKGD
jgi:hypothetical protein